MDDGAKPQKKAFAQLYALGPAVMEAIDARLARGESGLHVARWIQKDLHHLVTMKPDSLKKKLERYRSSHLRPRLEAEAQQRITDQPIEAFNSIQTDALTQLETLAASQQVRVNAILERERNIPGGILLKDVSGEIRLLKEILESIARLQMETGRIRKAPKTITGTVVDEDGNRQVFTWSEETRALYDQLKVVDLEVLDG